MGIKSDERQESTAVTGQMISRSHCSFSKVLTTTKPQQRAAPCVSFLLSWLCLTTVTRAKPECLGTRSACKTRFFKGEKKMGSKPRRWLPAAWLGSGHAHPWLQSPGFHCWPPTLVSLPPLITTCVQLQSWGKGIFCIFLLSASNCLLP